MSEKIRLFRIRVDVSPTVIGVDPTPLVPECDCFANSRDQAIAGAGMMAHGADPSVPASRLMVYVAEPRNACEAGCQCS